MDEALAFIQQDDVFSAMASLFGHLARVRANATPSEWRRFAQTGAMDHPIRSVAHLCPMTRRSFDKPRGYAGDAVMLDHIYGIEHPGPDYHPATVAGKVYAHTVNAPASRAVRHRREVLARLIDETANRCGDSNARIFSIAAGHLREAELSLAVQTRKLAEFDAMDQDRESLQIIERDYTRYGVRPQYGTVRDLLRNKTPAGHYDLVYAAGLFDYLEERVARKLVEVMLGMLRPKGKLLIANFARNIPDVGYMETFMDWWLIYRDSEEVRKLFPEPLQTSQQLRLFTDPGENIIFAEFTG